MQQNCKKEKKRKRVELATQMETTEEITEGSLPAYGAAWDVLCYFFHFYIQAANIAEACHSLSLCTAFDQAFFFCPPSHHKLDLMLAAVLRQTE